MDRINLLTHCHSHIQKKLSLTLFAKNKKRRNVEIPVYVLKLFAICQMLFLFVYSLQQFSFKDEKTESPGPYPDPWLATLRAYWLDCKQGSLSGRLLQPCLLCLNTCSFCNSSSSYDMISRPLTLF